MIAFYREYQDVKFCPFLWLNCLSPKRLDLVRVHRVYINDKIEGTSLNKHTLKAAAGEA
jgi:hypothetical protein